MRVIRRGEWPDPREWMCNAMCGRCRTEVELRKSDLFKTPTGWDQRTSESWGGEICWKCPGCDRSNTIKVHQSIANVIKERRS